MSFKRLVLVLSLVCISLMGVCNTSLATVPSDTQVESDFIVQMDASKDKTYWDLYGQVVLANGTLSGTNISLFSNPGAASLYSPPAIAFSPGGEGRALLVWVDDRTSTYDGDIWGRILAGNLIPQGDASFSINAGSGYQTGVQAVYAGYRRFLVTWEDRGVYPYIFYGQYVSDRGELLGDTFRLTPEGVFPYDNNLAGNGRGRCLTTYTADSELKTILTRTPFAIPASTLLQLLSD